MKFNTQGQAVFAAFAHVVGKAWEGPTKLELEHRQKIGAALRQWYDEEKWFVKSERCKAEIDRYIGGDPARAMKCNIIDNFLCRDKKAEAKQAKHESSEVVDLGSSKIKALKEMHAQGIITKEQLVEAILKLG